MSRLRLLLWACFLIAAVCLAGSRLKTSWPAALVSRLDTRNQTVFPARIEAARQWNLLSEYPGSIQAVSVSAGSRVKEGDLLLVLENSELSGQVQAATKRWETAALRLQAARASGSPERAQSIRREQLASAVRNRQAAQQRLDAFSPEETERALAAARQRVIDIRALVSQGLATAGELEGAQSREQTALTDFKTAREHLSRLKQEAEQAEFQVRLVEMQPAGAGTDIAAAAELELSEAGSAKTAAIERVRRLSVFAPASGTVLEVPVHKGDWVPSGMPLARIADLSSLTISAPVSATIARRIAPGRPVHVRMPTEPPLRLEAAVSETAMAPDSAQHAYLIRVTVPNPNPDAVLVGLEAAIEFDHLDRP